VGGRRILWGRGAIKILDAAPLRRATECKPTPHAPSPHRPLPLQITGSWTPDGDTAKGVAQLADGAGSLLGDADEGIVFIVPLAVVLGLVALLAGLLGTGVFMLFGVEALVAVTVEVALASVAGSLAYKGFTEGWLASALRHTGRGFLAAWVLSVLLGAGVDHWLPAAQSLPQALRMMHTAR
jgi:hypothetical protein